MTVNEAAGEAIHEIIAERRRQQEKWGVQDRGPYTYLAILMEEVGELAQAVLKHQFEDGPTGAIETEAIQAAAVAFALLECYYRGDAEGWRRHQEIGGK